ncbi:MAG: hypothetical protein EHM36_13615, partial [Deltaproteobacteria bacterium]
MDRLLKTGFLSLFIHLVLVTFLLSNLMSPYTRSGHAVYRVALRPFSPPGDGNPPGGAGSGPPKGPETPGPPSVPPVSEPPKADKGSDEGQKKDQPKIKTVEREEDSRSAKKKKKYEES